MSYVRNAVKVVRTLSPDEQKRILAITGQHRSGFRDHVLISIALGTALREHEIAALDIGDVLDSRGQPKTRIQLRTFAQKGKRKADAGVDKDQEVFIPKGTQRKLVRFFAWKKKNGEEVTADAPLFCSNTGDRLAMRTMRHLWRTWQQRAGFETLFSFHELRHTSLTNLWNATKDVLIVKRQARHKSVVTSQIYMHPSDNDQRKAVADLPS